MNCHVEFSGLKCRPDIIDRSRYGSGVYHGLFGTDLNYLERNGTFKTNVPPCLPRKMRGTLTLSAMHSRLVQMQPEVRLGGPGAPVLGARGVLAVPCPTDRRCCPGQHCPHRVAVRQVVEWSQRK